MSKEPERPAGVRKRIVSQVAHRSVGGVPEWLPVEELAEVEVTSEDPTHPVEHALTSQHGAGWRAAKAGPQTIRLLFDQPQTIHRIYLHFVEASIERTQEFCLRWAQNKDGPYEEIVRQRWNFSPAGSTHEIEDYRPAPRKVMVLELEIVPAVAGGGAHASLQQLHLA